MKPEIEKYYSQVWSSIRHKSKRRGHPMPDFSKEDMIGWMNRNGVRDMWQGYIDSGRDKYKKPSIDRIDDYGHYTFSNMQLITWRENLLKGVRGEKHRINCSPPNKKKVAAIDNNMRLVGVFESVTACAKYLGTDRISVSKVLQGKRMTIKKHRVIEAI